MLKATAEYVLARWLGPLLSRLQRDLVLVLSYHNVVPDGEPAPGDRSLHLSRSAFSAQLDALSESHRVVPLDRVFDGVGGGERAEPGGNAPPRAVVTFDDAYRGAMTCGVSELERRGLPATVFVSPGALGEKGFWWDRVAPREGVDGARGRRGRPARRSASGLRPDPEALLREEAGRDEAIISLARRENWPVADVPEHARPVTEEELRRAAGYAGLTLGAHGWSHANLACLNGDELEEETVRPLRWLESRFGDVSLPVLAYPYGHHSPAAAGAARSAGYRAAFTIGGGGFEPGFADRYRLPRVNVPAGTSLDGFRLRALGLVG